MCNCEKHFNEVAACTCKCDHGKTFTEHHEKENVIKEDD